MIGLIDTGILNGTMSDWEEFCEANGWNAGSAEDYDKFLESLEHEPRDVHNLNNDNDRLHFDTYENATKWARANPGRTIRRAESGIGFEAKPILSGNNLSYSPSAIRRNDQILPDRNDEIWTFSKRCERIALFSPQLKDVLTKSASNSSRINMHPFDRNKWKRELQGLNPSQLEQLRLLVLVHLEDSRRTLKQIEAEIRRFRQMKPGHYGESLNEALQHFLETLLPDFDRLLINR